MYFQGMRFCDQDNFDIVQFTPTRIAYKPCKLQTSARPISDEADTILREIYEQDYTNQKKFSYSTCQRYFNLASTDLQLSLNGKACDVHLFRYNRMRVEHDKGLDIGEIQDKYGLSDPSIVTDYLYRDIYLVS